MTAQLRVVLDAYPMLPADLRRRLERDLEPLCAEQAGGGDYSREDLIAAMTTPRRENTDAKLRQLLRGVGCVEYVFHVDGVDRHVAHFHDLRYQCSEQQVQACIRETVGLEWSVLLNACDRKTFKTWECP